MEEKEKEGRLKIEDAGRNTQQNLGEGHSRIFTHTLLCGTKDTQEMCVWKRGNEGETHMKRHQRLNFNILDRHFLNHPHRRVMN